jgi:hypothetical protein
MNPNLRKLIRTLVEAAVNSTIANNQGLALMRKPQGSMTAYVLYDPVHIEPMFSNDDLITSDSKAIIGYLVVQTHQGECWNAGEVKLAAAKSGYGPLMYQYAMNDYAGGIFPDRQETSKAAQAVWKKFEQRPDTEKRKFDDITSPITPPKEDDCELAWGTKLHGDTAFLNQAYDAPGDASGRSNLLQNHEDFLQMLSDTKKWKKHNIESVILDFGGEFFSTRYTNG